MNSHSLLSSTLDGTGLIIFGLVVFCIFGYDYVKSKVRSKEK
jgi:hypothetical protein